MTVIRLLHLCVVIISYGYAKIYAECLPFFFKHCLKLSLEDRPLFWIIRDFCCWCIVCFVVIFFLQWSSYSYIYWQNRILILLMSVYESKAFLWFFLKLRYLGVYCSINDNVNLGPFKIHMVLRYYYVYL